ncbi:MAG: UDP-glucose 4-epimerase GalE, partial [Chlamydiae bacterium]|nr:UDP-glucose 4-epimerase GalE [Chlamydiota bacterium]
MSEPILVTGGAGYIGSHVCKALSQQGFLPITFDNLITGHLWAVKWGPFIKGDLCDFVAISQAISTFKPKAVIHLASFANVRESMLNPLKYYRNNFIGTLTLLEAMVLHDIRFFLFSSSCSVYGNPTRLPIDEKQEKLPINPYGKTKWMIESLLEDLCKTHGISSLSLRYFNAAGADHLGEIGEDHDPETHLIPLAIFSALHQNIPLKIFGNQMKTKDGTAIRDYIHVLDLADAHIKGLSWLEKNQGIHSFNLGTGTGY